MIKQSKRDNEMLYFYAKLPICGFSGKYKKKAHTSFEQAYQYSYRTRLSVDYVEFAFDSSATEKPVSRLE